MTADPLYTIGHFNVRDLLQAKGYPPGTGKAYRVYWWNEIPLGHCWIENAADSATDFRKIWETINATLDFYCASSETVKFDLLALAWEKKDFTLCLSLLDEVFERYAFHQQGVVCDLSLIICTRNRTAHLKRCLEALAGLSAQPREVIVVDNAPDDQSTRDLVAAFPDVKYILEPQKGLDRARNAGWRHATASIVAYTDDDVRLHKDFVWQTVKAFDHPRIQAVTGLVFAEELDTKAQMIFEKYWSFNRGYLDVSYDTDYFKKHVYEGVPAWEAGAGANMAFRRAALRDTGGFDDRLDVGASGCSGDSEMWYRLMAAGWTIHYTPRAIAYHTHRREMGALRNQIYDYLRGCTSSLLVQYQRTGHRGNLHYLFHTLPVNYARSVWQKIRGRYLERHTNLGQEIKGGLSGIGYFMNHRDIPAEQHEAEELTAVSECSVSVVITTYNHARFISEAIESVLRQTMTPSEIIVVDDGSTDQTWQIVSRYPRATYIRQENKGLAAARNTGVFCSKGNYIVFLDADDQLYSDAVEANLRYFKEHPSVAFISGWHDKVDENKIPIETREGHAPDGDYYSALLRGNYIGMHGAVMYRREIFSHFLFDEMLPACEDYDLYLRITKRYPVFSHNEKLAAYRMHGDNMSKDIGLMLKQVKMVLRRNADRADATVKKHYKAGIKNWSDYYTNKMYHRITHRYRYPGYNYNAKDLFRVTGRMPGKMAKFYAFKITGLLGRRAEERRPGSVRMGDLRRTAPLSKVFGYDRGGPVDRYYIENFLAKNAGAIQGNVLEIGDNAYTMAYGGGKVVQSDILFIDDSNPRATIIGDLSTADHIPDKSFDCIILTQTLHLIYDFDAAIAHCFRILKSNGVLLLTVPGITQIDYGEWHDTWYWSFTGKAVQKLLTKSFSPPNVEVNTYGNVLAAASFLYGMGQNEIEESKLNQTDPHYQVIITAKAVRH